MNINLTGNIIIRHQSIPDCEWCDKSKELLDQKGIKYTVINSDKKFFGVLMKQTKSTQVPQIIMNGEFVGDYNNLVEYLEKENNAST
mgnify:CR=1 FL=1|tara:strand:+ start:877 stop:1137 length:261 start_codon:yes stop_codon:yes gene_type:complete